MNTEQIKLKKFFDKLTQGTVNKTLAQMLMGLCLFLLVINCLIPVQEIFFDATEESPILIPMFTQILATFATYLRICSYEGYTENQKTRAITEILQYHPVDWKELKKMKILCVFRFLGTLTVVALFLQLGVTYLAYKSISWLNVGYIVLFVFLAPFFFEVVPIYFRNRR